MPAKIHTTQEGFVRSALAGMNALNRLGILTAAVIGAITVSGTKAKLVTAIANRRAAVVLHDAQQVQQYNLALSDFNWLIDSGVLLDADVETARAAGTDKYLALYDPIKNLLTFPETIINAGNQ